MHQRPSKHIVPTW